MSDANPTNSKSYRPGDEKRGYNELITLTLTERVFSDIINTIFEFTSGPFYPSDEEWEWLENVMGLPTQDSLEELGRKIGRFRGCYDYDDSQDSE